MKYREQRELVEDLRTLADFYERPKSIVLDKPNLSFASYVTKYDSSSGEYGPNFEKSRARLARIVHAIGACDKDFGSEQLTVRKKLGNGIMLKFYVTREAVCKKVLTGNKTVYAAQVIPERVVEDFEWECEDVSLFRLAKEA